MRGTARDGGASNCASMRPRHGCKDELRQRAKHKPRDRHRVREHAGKMLTVISVR
jgi:hypothetical protein